MCKPALAFALAFAGSAAAALLAATASGQSTVVVPKGWTKIAGHWYDISLTYGTRYTPMHTQYAYDVSDFGFAAAGLKSLAMRNVNYTWYFQGSRIQTMTVALSHGPNAPRNLSFTFAANEGNDRKQVFSGKVVFPSYRYVKGVPPYNVRVPFSSPFPFLKTRGQSLVVDARVTTSSASGGDWKVEAAIHDWGRIHGFNHTQLSSCSGSGSNWVHKLNPLQPGGRFSVTYFTRAAKMPGMVSVGFVGVGGTWAGQKLPIDLTPMGAPGCSAAVASLFWWPFTTGTAIPPLAIPNQSNVIGVHFFDQAYVIDRKANALGLYPLNSIEWAIGSGMVPSVGEVHIVSDNPPKKQGWRYVEPQAPVMQFGY